MTQFVDLVLNWNRGGDWRPPAAPADWSVFAAAELPLTDGAHQVTPDPQRGRDLVAAVDHGCILIASHTISREDLPEDQAAAVAEALPDRGTPLLILPPPHPTADAFDLIVDTVYAMTEQELNPRLLYMPRFYWEAIGSPNLLGVLSLTTSPMAMMIESPTATWSLDPAGNPFPGYPGDDSPQWEAFGGLRGTEIALLRVPGASSAAYRGTRDDFARLLGVKPRAAAPAPAPSAEQAAA